MPKKQSSLKRLKQAYPLHQCALYKVGSKRRLSHLLGLDLKELISLSKKTGNYSVFEMPAEVCEFTGKVKKARWVQNPVPELKELHRRIQTLLSRVAVPAYCHGGPKGRSYRSNAAVHVSATYVATFDLKSFFPSTKAEQVFSFFFDDLKCAPDVAGLLTDLCTYQRALPTGSPVSPLLAFWANHALFSTLQKRAQEQNLNLSVYVDDVTFSGKSLPSDLVFQVESIVQKYGQRLSTNKTKRFGPNSPKHVTGVVIHNGRLMVPHARFYKARAIERAIKNALEDGRRELLTAKLGGLLGEAAFIDARYKAWAERCYEDLALIKSKRKNLRTVHLHTPVNVRDA
nr:reverse transcriptase family protein [uncultured Limnohabitans sp.]